MTQMTITGFEIKGQEGVFDMVKLRDGIQNHNIGSILNVPTWRSFNSKWKEVNNNDKQ
jgi:beta-glucosidase